jgi:hypothetical protein
MKIGGYATKFTFDTVTVGCTTVTRPQILAVLRRMDKAKKPKFPLGSKVRVIGRSGDDSDVTGRTGIVISVTPDCRVLVRFPKWYGGHDGDTGKGTSYWWVSTRGLKKVSG